MQPFCGNLTADLPKEMTGMLRSDDQTDRLTAVQRTISIKAHCPEKGAVHLFAFRIPEGECFAG